MTTLNNQEWETATDITEKSMFPAFDFWLQERAYQRSYKTRNADNDATIPVQHMFKPISFIDEVIFFQLNTIIDSDSFLMENMQLPNNIAAYNTAHDSEYFSDYRIGKNTKTKIINDLSQKFSYVVYEITKLRMGKIKTTETLALFNAKVTSLHQWYVDETFLAFSRFPGDTKYCLDTVYGCGEYTWSIISQVSSNSLQDFIQNEFIRNKAVQKWQTPRMELHQVRRVTCTGLRSEIPYHYLQNVCNQKITRIRLLETYLTELPCKKADDGQQIWKEHACLADWKAKIGIPLFCSCDSRACCTTLCRYGLEKFLSNTNSLAAKNLLRKPIIYRIGCSVTLQRILAVMMSSHPRLGEHSSLFFISEDIIMKIIELIREADHEESGTTLLKNASLNPLKTQRKPITQQNTMLVRFFSYRNISY